MGQLRPFLHPLQRQEGESVAQRSWHVLGGASGKARVEPLPAGQQSESATVLDAIRERCVLGCRIGARRLDIVVLVVRHTID